MDDAPRHQQSQANLFSPWILAGTFSSLLAALFIAYVRSSLGGSEPGWLPDLPEQLVIALVMTGLALGLALLGLLVSIPQCLVIQFLGIHTRRWMLFTSLGFVIGDLVIGVLLTVLFRPPLPERMNSTYWFLEKFLPLLGLGIGVGASQWLQLRARIPRASLWVLAHAVSFPSGYIAALILPSRLFRILTPNDSLAFLRLDSAYHSSLFNRLLPVFLAGLLTTCLTAWLLHASRIRGHRNGAA